MVEIAIYHNGHFLQRFCFGTERVDKNALTDGFERIAMAPFFCGVDLTDPNKFDVFC